MSTINQQNQNGDNIGKNKYVITIGSSEIKLLNILYLIALILIVIYKKFFVSILTYVFFDHLWGSIIISLPVYFIIRKVNHKLVYLSILSIVTIAIYVYVDISPRGKALHGINYLGFFIFDENGNMKTDDYADNLSNLSSSALKEKSEQHASFGSKQYDLNVIKVPYFIISILGVDGINNIVYMRQNDYHILDFYYVLKDNKITLNILPNLDIYIMGNQINWAAGEISKLSTCLDFENFNTLSSSILIATFGQSCIQLVYSNSLNFALAHSIALDSEKLINEVEKYALICPSNEDFIKLVGCWKANLYREKFQIALLQENYSEAINYFCKAFNYSSTFPYATYDKFKAEYPKSYYKDVGQLAIDNGSDSSLVENINTNVESDQIGFLLENFQMLPKEYLPSLFKALTKNKKSSDPVYWFLLSKVAKYLPPTNPNEQIHNEIYLSQLKKSSQYLDSMLVIDPNFRIAESLKELYTMMMILNSVENSEIEKPTVNNLNSDHFEHFNKTDN